MFGTLMLKCLYLQRQIQYAADRCRSKGGIFVCPLKPKILQTATAWRYGNASKV